MSKRKKDISKKNTAKEPSALYKRNLRIFSSFEEQQKYELIEMAKLKPEEILLQLRKFINIAFGMEGYDSQKLPKKHSIKIISGSK